MEMKWIRIRWQPEVWRTRGCAVKTQHQFGFSTLVLFFTLPVLAFLLEYPIGMWRETLQARMLRAGARFGSGGGAVVWCWPPPFPFRTELCSEPRLRSGSGPAASGTRHTAQFAFQSGPGNISLFRLFCASPKVFSQKELIRHFNRLKQLILES